MARLPPSWVAHLQQGVSLRVGSSSPDGQPELFRALVLDLRPEGSIELLIAREVGAPLLAAIQATGRVAVVAGLPSSYRVLHLKGRDAEVLPPRPDHEALLRQRLRLWIDEVCALGSPRAPLQAALDALRLADLRCVRFTPYGAWDQTPGPGAGQPVDLLP